MSRSSDPVDGRDEQLEASSSGERRRHRRRKRRNSEIVAPRWRWWQLLAALGVALLAGGITILLVRGSSTWP